jgi:hypothetical protein
MKKENIPRTIANRYPFTKNKEKLKMAQTQQTFLSRKKTLNHQIKEYERYRCLYQDKVNRSKSIPYRMRIQTRNTGCKKLLNERSPSKVYEQDRDLLK